MLSYILKMGEMERENLNFDIDQLLIKCVEGSASDEECQAAWEWVKQSEENRRHYETLRDVWLATSTANPVDNQTTEEFWLKIRNKIKTNTPKTSEPNQWLRRFIRVAAIILITFSLGTITGKVFFSKRAEVAQDKSLYTIVAPRGAKSFVTLIDGTKVWLNAGSKISYKRSYNQENRDIFLEGEAFFEVAKNKEVPFFVHSSGIVVRAIGTAFNVKAYPEEGIVETTLVEGSISIESTNKSGKKEQTLMQPNQKANFYIVSQKLVVEAGEKAEEQIPETIKPKIERIEVKKRVDTEIYTSWKDKRWVFEKQKFEDFAVIMERIYDVKIMFRDQELKSYNLSGSLEEENLEQVLKALRFIIPMDFTINHNEVVLSINTKLKNRYMKTLKNN